MSVTSIVTTVIKASDNKSQATIQFDFTTNKLKAPIELVYGGSKLTFPSVTEYQNFLNQTLYPSANKLASSSGAGVGYNALLAPSVGTDTITD